MIAIDWSHTKSLTTYDGCKVRYEERATLLKRLKLNFSTSFAGESTIHLESNLWIKPTIVLEQGCPLSLIYNILSSGAEVKLISNQATQDYRVGHFIEKSDENDCKIIYYLSQNGAKLTDVQLSDAQVKMYSLYHQYCRYQKVRVSMINAQKAHLRHYGDADLSPYDIAIKSFKDKEISLLKELISLLGGESNSRFPSIKGLGPRLKIGILVAANPKDFKCLSTYLRYCGLVNLKSVNYKYSRHAKMLYHLLAEEIVRCRDPIFRPLYDKFKEDMRVKYAGESKSRINNASLNRTSTFLAKEIYKCFSNEVEVVEAKR